MKQILYKVIPLLAIFIITIMLVISSITDYAKYDHFIGRQIGPWTANITSSVEDNNGQFSINVVLEDGANVLLKDENKDMFDIPKGTTIQFWGTIEKFDPLIIDVGGIKW